MRHLALLRSGPFASTVLAEVCVYSQSSSERLLCPTLLITTTTSHPTAAHMHIIYDTHSLSLALIGVQHLDMLFVFSLQHVFL